MAWACLVSGILQTIVLLATLILAPVDRVTALAQYGALFMAMYGFYAGVIMAYVGTAAYSDVRLWKS